VGFNLSSLASRSRGDRRGEVGAGTPRGYTRHRTRSARRDRPARVDHPNERSRCLWAWRVRGAGARRHRQGAAADQIDQKLSFVISRADGRVG